jgi:hypothetical protein
MKQMIKLLITSLIGLAVLACNSSKTDEPAIPKVGNIVEPDQQSGRGTDTLIRDSATAISIAEPVLFKVYGKEQILGEKPYKVQRIDGYWHISGTLPEGIKGGVFNIILSAKMVRWLI